MTFTDRQVPEAVGDRVRCWWDSLDELDRQRVREFRANAQLPADLIDSYGRTVGGSISAPFGTGAGVFDMPTPVISFLDEDPS